MKLKQLIITELAKEAYVSGNKIGLLNYFSRKKYKSKRCSSSHHCSKMLSLLEMKTF